MHSTLGQHPYGTNYHHLLFYTSPRHYQPSYVSPCQPSGKCNPCTASTCSKVDKFLYIVFIHFCFPLSSFWITFFHLFYFLLADGVTHHTSPSLAVIKWVFGHTKFGHMIFGHIMQSMTFKKSYFSIVITKRRYYS